MIIALDARPLVTRQIKGVEQHARNIVASWAQMNLPHSFVLVYEKPGRQAEEFDESFVNALPPEKFQQLMIRGFQFAPQAYLGLSALGQLARSLRRLQVDVYHSFWIFVPESLPCPAVQTIHDLSFELDPVVRQLHGSFAERHAARHGAKLAARIIAVSAQTRNDILSVYRVAPECVSVVQNGINPVFTPEQNLELRAAVREKWKIDAPYVLSVGSDIPRRNYDRLFSAMRTVWQQDAAVKFLVAGRNQWEITPLYKMAVDAGLLSRMIFVRSPTDQELAQLYRGAILTCCASSFEGFGLSVLESLACGCAVACSDMKSLREVAEDAAIYFGHDDPESMSTAIASLLEDADYRRQLRNRGLARAAQFTWPRAARQVMEVLEACGQAVH